MTSLQQVANSYTTKRSRIVNVIITSQDQEIELAHDIELCDVQLVGGYAVLLHGYVTNGEIPVEVVEPRNYWPIPPRLTDDTLEQYIPQGELYSTYVDLWDNGVNHDMVSVHIDGMDKGHHYMRDGQSAANSRLHFLVHTDKGYWGYRTEASKAVSAAKQTFEAVHLSPRCTVHTEFTGSRPDQERKCHFVDDMKRDVMAIVDSSDAATADTIRTKFDYQGKDILFYVDVHGNLQTRYPPNSIVKLVLQFQVTPRVVL